MFKSLRISSVQMQKYNLTWHTYSDHLRNIFQEIHLDQSSADVTLVTDDKKLLKAHKNILSACSSVFKDMLQLNMSNNHSVIYLRGIQHSEMESILQFIYLGEAKFYEERINEFLKVAKNLDIRELGKKIEAGDSCVNEEKDTEEKGIVEEEEEPIEQTQKMLPSEDDDSINAKKHEPYNEAMSKECQQCPKYQCQQCDKVFKEKNSVSRHIQSVHDGVKYGCSQCNQQFTQYGGLKRHVLSVHEGVTYACNQCDYKATQKGSLKGHILSKHEGVKYACSQCDYEATFQSALKNHIKSVH